MNHPVHSSLAALLAPLAMAMLVAGGCGEAFSASGGSGGEGATSSTTHASVSAASGSGGSTSSSGVTSSTGTGTPSMCGSNKDCTAEQVCVKASCGAGASGTCEAAATSETEFAPVCGCDGITYWNTLLSKASSKQIRAVGECVKGVSAKGCDLTNGCSGGDVHCAYGRSKCDVITGGTCWVTPPHCDQTTAGAKTCNGLMTGECRNLCTTIANTSPTAFLANAPCTP